jgi:hypothetical protein
MATSLATGRLSWRQAGDSGGSHSSCGPVDIDPWRATRSRELQHLRILSDALPRV